MLILVFRIINSSFICEADESRIGILCGSPSGALKEKLKDSCREQSLRCCGPSYDMIWCLHIAYSYLPKCFVSMLLVIPSIMYVDSYYTTIGTYLSLWKNLFVFSTDSIKNYL